MMVQFGFPYALFLLILLVPALTIELFQFKKLLGSVEFLSGSKVKKNIRRRISFRMLFFSLAWICLVFAFSDPSWGTKPVPLQKNGTAVSFVFDISYSMMAEDMPEFDGSTRLESAKIFSRLLLGRLDNTAVSVVIAKGEGITAVPLTEDFYAVESFIEQLSPAMMTAAGTSLAKGVEAAMLAFPGQSARRSTIILFTDGDETDNMLSSAVTKAVKNGTSVIFVGFGSPLETEVIAGDGITPVKTALREDKLESIANTISNTPSLQHGAKVLYFDALQNGAASGIIKAITAFGDSGQTGYEIQSIKRYPLFIVMALIFLALGVLSAELRIKTARINIAIVFTCLLLCSCSANLKNAAEVLEGTISWYQKNYTNATSRFADIAEKSVFSNDPYLLQYGLYGLSSAYIMQNEGDAALEKINQISKDAPADIRFAAMYNAGIIAHTKGDYSLAVKYFKDALLVDSSNIDAKINLELSLSKEDAAKTTESQYQAKTTVIRQDSAMEEVIFSVIKENERNLWKNPEPQKSASTVIDY